MEDEYKEYTNSTFERNINYEKYLKKSNEANFPDNNNLEKLLNEKSEEIENLYSKNFELRSKIVQLGKEKDLTNNLISELLNKYESYCDKNDNYK